MRRSATQHRGVDRARAQRDAAHPVRPAFQRHRLGQRHDSRLGDVVRGVAGELLDVGHARQRADVDDDPAARRGHAGEGGAAAEVGAAQVDVEDRVPPRGVELGERRWFDHPRVVDPGAQLTLLRCHVGEAQHVVLDADVGLERHDGAVVGGGLVESRLGATDGDDAHPVGGEPARGGAADAGAGSGDHGDAAGRHAAAMSR